MLKRLLIYFVASLFLPSVGEATQLYTTLIYFTTDNSLFVCYTDYPTDNAPYVWAVGYPNNTSQTIYADRCAPDLIFKDGFE